MFYIGRNLCTPCLPFYYLFFAMSFLRLFFLYKLSLYTEQPGGLTSLYLPLTDQCFFLFSFLQVSQHLKATKHWVIFGPR